MKNENPNIPVYYPCPILVDHTLATNNVERQQMESENLKLVAIYQLGLQMLKSLEMLEHLHKCEAGLFTRSRPPQQLFSWNYEYFLKRRQLNMVWFNLLLKKLTMRCLETKKIIMDFEELGKFIKLLLQSYLQKIQNFDSINFLKSAIAFIGIEDTLSKELTLNTNILNKWLLDMITNQFTQKPTRYFLKTLTHSDLDSIKPFKLRYSLAYQLNVEEQTEIYTETKNGELEKKITYYLKRIKDDEFCSQNSLYIYFVQIESYSKRVREMEKKYNDEYEKICNAVAYKQSSIESIQFQQKIFEDEIKRFQEVKESIRRQQSIQEPPPAPIIEKVKKRRKPTKKSHSPTRRL